MALPQLHWKKIVYATGSVTATVDVLDAIYAALTSSTYHDTSARTPGSGSAWTASRYRLGGTTTEAVYATPPAAAVSGFRAVWAGVDSGSYTPTMLASDTWAVDRLVVGVNRNSGAFNAWDNAAPFTSGNFSGYSRWCNVSVTIDYVIIYESEEAIMVSLVSSTNTVYACMAGAYLDPLSTDALDEEQTHQRIFGMTNGASAGMSWLHNAAGGGWLGHSGTDGSGHHTLWLPNSSLSNCQWYYFGSSAGTDTYVLQSGGYLTAPILIIHTGTSRAVGVARGIYWAPEMVHSNTITQGGVEKGHGFSPSTVTSADALIYRSN